MIRAEFTDYITAQDGRVVRYVEARWPATRSHKAGRTTVYREFENGKKQVRKLCFHPIAGYMVDEGDLSSWTSAILECRALSDGYNVYGHDLSEEEIATITEAHPEFRWTLQKAGECNCAKAMRLLQQWLKNPKVELLVGAHYDRLSLNRSFVRYGKEKQRKILNFVKNNDSAKNWPLPKIKFVMEGHTAKEYDDWKSFRDIYNRAFSYESYKYLTSKRIKKDDLELYRDYIAMAKECGHNIKDKYWYAPKNLHKAHEKVMAEVELVRDARRKELAELEKKEELKKFEAFRKVGKKFGDLITRYYGLTVYVPQDTDIVDKHAKALHQCLVYADYIGKMARQSCLLVFITTREGAPVATAEILPSGKVGQFYGDEGGRNIDKMKPGKKAQEALDAWLKKFKPKWRKAA